MSISKGIALITGSAQGIGRGIALRLAKDGYDIAVNDIPSKRDQLRAVADDIDKIGRKALILPADVAVEEQVKEMIQEVSKELGGLDVMVANAGVAQKSVLTSITLEDWERVMAINTRGIFLCYKHAAQQMINQGRGGRIIGASSVAGKKGFPSFSAYSASKFAVRGLTQSAAVELGQYDITVNAYAPGFIETPMSAIVDAASKEVLLSMQSIKHNGQPEDIASLVSYLASKEAHFITGQCIAVDGGMSVS